MATGTKPAELRTLTDDELVEKLRQLESHGRLRAFRKDIARIYTIMRERELGITPVGAA